MNYHNIAQIGFFRHVVEGSPDVMMPSNVQADPHFGFLPSSINYYLGISPKGRQILSTEGSPLGLNATHRKFRDDLVTDLLTNPHLSTLQLTLGLEPLNPTDPFGYMKSQVEWLTAIASQLNDTQEKVAAENKTLKIVIRFASEMNDPGNLVYGPKNAHSSDYKAAFIITREIFRKKAPNIAFSFCPALRADTKEAALHDYWPGSVEVDILAGTWYVGRTTDFKAAFDVMQAYVEHRASSGKPFGISEIGGMDDHKNNTPMLKQMMDSLGTIKFAGRTVPFSYVVLFADKAWGQKLDCSFLRSPAGFASNATGIFLPTSPAPTLTPA